ncbi:MAG: hypothetical protein AAB538_00980 [Patescibacteria group bacterium]
MASGSKIGFWAVGALVVLGIVVWAAASREDQPSLNLKPLIQNEPFAVAVEFEGASAQAGKTQHAHVAVSRDGQPFDVYSSGYALHLIVASSDLSTFLHTVDLHDDGFGVYGADVTFGSPGKYRLWVEVNDASGEQHHGEGAPLIGYADFRVRGEARGVTDQPRVHGKVAQAGPYTVKLDYASLRAGEESEVRLAVQDAQGRVRQLTQPEPNIYVMIGPKGDSNFPFFRHGHSEPALNGNTVVWRETFPKAGEYLLWTTVYVVNGSQFEAVEVPFVLMVVE